MTHHARRAFGAGGLHGALADADRPQHPVVDVSHSLPRDRRRIEVQPREATLLLLGELAGLGFVDPELAEPAELHRREADGVVTLLGQPAEERGVALRALVVHASVERRREQVVRDRDRVDVTRQVQVEVLHWDHLRVACIQPARSIQGVSQCR